LLGSHNFPPQRGEAVAPPRQPQPYAVKKLWLAWNRSRCGHTPTVYMSHRLLNSSGTAHERGSAQVTKVSRSTISNTSARQIAIKRLSPPTRAAATGVTVLEFVDRAEPRRCCSSVPLSSASGASPRDALLPVFLRIKRAATAKVFHRIAARLARGRSTVPRVGAVPDGFASNHVKTGREASPRALPRGHVPKSKPKRKWPEVRQ
jgi:hypothetical protein